MPQPDPSPERRHDARIRATVDVAIEVFGEDRLIGGRSLDLSLGGMKVRAPIAAEGTVCILLPPAPEEFATLGEVLDVTVIPDEGEAEMRIKFRDLTDSARGQLAELLDRLSSGQGPD